MPSFSGNAFEPSCMHSNLHPHTFGLKVRMRGSQPSILVRTFSLFTRVSQKLASIRINLTKWRWILCRGDGILSGGQVEWSGAGRARFAMHYVCAYGGGPPSEDVPLPCGALST